MRVEPLITSENKTRYMLVNALGELVGPVLDLEPASMSPDENSMENIWNTHI